MSDSTTGCQRPTLYTFSENDITRLCRTLHDPEPLLGRVTITKLIRDSIRHFKSGITETDLPQTFIDAIAVARALNIQYLWIDSLCIMQDLTLDCAREPSLMSEVYRNSICNIGASTAIDGSGSLFCKRNPSLVHTYRFIHNNELFYIAWTGMFYASIGKAPLYKRG